LFEENRSRGYLDIKEKVFVFYAALLLQLNMLGSKGSSLLSEGS